MQIRLNARLLRTGDRHAVTNIYVAQVWLGQPPGVTSWMLSKWQIGCLSLVCILTLFGCSPAVDNKSQTVPKPVQVAGSTLVWGRDVKTAALLLIAQSTRYCDLDMYELSDSDVLRALAAARQRGVNVRVVLDATEKHSQKTGVPALRANGVPVASLRISRGISHIKMLATDHGVLLGGMNFGSASWLNNDASITMSGVHPAFVALFESDWQRANGHAINQPTVPLPLVVDARIGEVAIEAITSARSNVKIEAFDLTDRRVIAALISAMHRGVDVQILLDPTQSYNRKSASRLRSAGATVQYYVPYQNELMHAKILDVDDGRIFLIGSANFSHQAYTYNHEGDLLIHNVGPFDAVFSQNLSKEIARGVDYPESKKHTGW